MSNKKKPEIPLASMADIAFLLLVFFLIATTIDADKGILVTLPPWPEEPPPPIEKNNRNILTILVNGDDKLLVENEELSIKQLKVKTMAFVNNYGADKSMSDNPQEAVVSLKNDRATSYNAYIQVQNELKAAYNELRNRKAQDLYATSFTELKKCRKTNTACKEKYITVKKMFPIKISEAEPERF